jgi:GR25 family glycosyltransferase involved in LPS biosynthesis
MKIRYINLERSPERRVRIESLLAEQGLTEISNRFTGIVPVKPLDGLAVSVTGCLMSHLSLLGSLRESETTLILEDDACFSQNFGKNIRTIPSLIDNANLDIIFLGQTVAFNDVATHAHLIKLLNKLSASGKHQLLDAAKFYRYGAFGYVINKKPVSKVRKLVEELDLSSDAKPIDTMLRQWLKANKLKGSVMFPSLVGVDPSIESTMHDRSDSLTHRLHCELVNLYMNDKSSEAHTDWNEILNDNPNQDALAICKIIYTRLTQ